MAETGVVRYIYFRLADTFGNPITGRPSESFAVIFTRDNLTPPDALTITEIAAGRYYATYTPSTSGTDYLEIYDVDAGVRIEDVEVIANGFAAVHVTQDYGGTDMLRPPVLNPADYTLYAFLSSAWNTGRNTASDAAASYHLDAGGNWALDLLPGIYDLVLMNNSGTVTVFQFNLAVS